MRRRLRRVTPAANFQDPRDPVRHLAEQHEKAVYRDFRAALRDLRRVIPVKRIAELMREGRFKEAVDEVSLKHFREVLKAPMNAVNAVHEAAATIGAGQITERLRRAGKEVRYHRVARHGLRYSVLRPNVVRIGKDTGFGFDRFDAATQARLRARQDEIIAELDAQARSTIEMVILDGVRADDTFEQIAAAIRDTITLTRSQAQAVLNYRNDLEDLDPNALARALRNTTLDSEVEDAIFSGQFLDDAMIEQLVQDYADNYLDYRAATISRTESLRAANEGLRDGYQQAADRGVFPEEAVTRQWLAAIDERTCPVCLSIVENNPDGVGLYEDFQSDDGPAGDPPIHPNCRCTVQYVTNLDMVPATDEETF